MLLRISNSTSNYILLQLKSLDFGQHRMYRLLFLLAGFISFFCSAANTADEDEICKMIQVQTCIKGPSTRTINGIRVYRKCWEYGEKYECASRYETNTCAGLEQYCEKLEEKCEQTDHAGNCALQSETYSCGEKQPKGSEAIFIRDTTTFTTSKDETECESYRDNPTCEEYSSMACVEPGETRIVDGHPVYKACWRWEEVHMCFDRDINYCLPLETICHLVKKRCLDENSKGYCIDAKWTYDCNESQPTKYGIKFINKEYTIIDEHWEGTCDSLDPECVEQGRVCVEGPETRNINGALIYRDCWRHEKQFTCLSGKPTNMCNNVDKSVCRQVNQTCVAEDSKGRCLSRAIQYECTYKYSDSTVIDCGNQMFCMGDDCYDTGYQPNNEFGLAAAYLGAATQAGEQITADSIDIFSGHKSTCSKFAASSVDCCDDSGWANGSFTGCSNVDKKLIEERKNKLTHFIGTYCAKKLKPFNVCIEYRESYCTFNSMLARIVQQGARPQLKMDWGSAKSPTCNGLKPEHFDHIDFTRIDFSEYINEMKVDMVDNADIARKVEDKVSKFLAK